MRKKKKKKMITNTWQKGFEAKVALLIAVIVKFHLVKLMQLLLNDKKEKKKKKVQKDKEKKEGRREWDQISDAQEKRERE